MPQKYQKPKSSALAEKILYNKMRREKNVETTHFHKTAKKSIMENVKKQKKKFLEKDDWIFSHTQAKWTAQKFLLKISQFEFEKKIRWRHHQNFLESKSYKHVPHWISHFGFVLIFFSFSYICLAWNVKKCDFNVVLWTRSDTYWVAKYYRQADLLYREVCRWYCSWMY